MANYYWELPQCPKAYFESFNFSYIDWTRTSYQLIKCQSLYHLSYNEFSTGIEPVSSDFKSDALPLGNKNGLFDSSFLQIHISLKKECVSRAYRTQTACKAEKSNSFMRSSLIILSHKPLVSRYVQFQPSPFVHS